MTATAGNAPAAPDTARQHLAENIGELGRLADAIDVSQLAGMLDLLDAALVSGTRIHVTGVGRSGLAAKAVAMRLMHLGLDMATVGDVCSPGIRPRDVLLAVSASGRGALLRQAQTARAGGARVVSICGTRVAELVDLSEVSLCLPARTEVSTAQHAGSLFEQGVLVVGDALCRTLQIRRGIADEDLDQRHANLL